ncbi:hypothetical protein BDV59DRAFT_76243 [Aspergillus ambiguus]|uniref:putative raffinose synthase protein Sip1 n=1 Tax=Aspergillus ambiguus TaxID=176160 RepID=UPI003CCD942D
MQSSTSAAPILGPNVHRQMQAHFNRPAQMTLFSRVTCAPPLGQVTCPPRIQKGLGLDQDDTLRFTVVIESSDAFPEQPWEAQIWHNINNPEWSALPLRTCQNDAAPLLTGNDAEWNYYRHTFSEELVLPSNGGCGQFTVRFRASPGAEWQWVNQLQQSSDGQVVFPPRRPVFDETATSPSTGSIIDGFSTYFSNISTEIQICPRKSEAPGSALWNISGKTKPAIGNQSGLKNIVLGTPTSLLRYFALVRIWTPWLGPRHGGQKFSLTEDALLCSFLRADGVHVVLLAVSGIDNILTLLGSSENGEVVIKTKSDNNLSANFQVLASAADSFDVAMSAVIYEARKVVRPFAADEGPEGVSTPVSPLGDDVVMVEKDPEAQWLSEWYDGLTYCTWNGLGQDLSEDKILRALDTLERNGIQIANLIIDDNWQSLDQEGEPQFKRAWTQFEANKHGFPYGLKHTVDRIRQKNPKIGHIGVWHAIFGYWGGISPTGELATSYKTKDVDIIDPSAGGPMADAFRKGSILIIDPEEAQRFYDDFYSFLSSAGIDTVKADAQFFLDLVKHAEDRRNIITAYQDAFSISSLRHFGTKAISSMAQFPQAIFHSQLPTNKPTTPLRNSDDFFPEVPASHPWHVFCNAHNALLTRYLNVLPDWDMFQTSHLYASFHAAARCVSGGPIYITDEPGKHNIALVESITAPTTNGRTVVLRPGLVGRTIDTYHNYNEGHILRVGTYCGWARTGSGILGLFNISSFSSSSIVSLLDFPGVHEDYDGQYLVRAHTSGKLSEPMRAGGENSAVAVDLHQRGWEILTSYPIHTLTMRENKQCNVSVLGLLGKMTGAAAIVNSDINVEPNGRLRCDVSLKALGTLGVYFSLLPGWNVEDNFMVMILGRPVPRKTVRKEGGSGTTILAINVLAAWRQMRLDPGWSNEVTVQIFVA